MEMVAREHRAVGVWVLGISEKKKKRKMTASEG